MSRASEKQIAFLRTHKVQSTPPNRQSADELIRFINESNYYSNAEERPLDRVTAILTLEALWLGRRFVITGEHHPRRGEMGIVTHIQPVNDIWNGKRGKWNELLKRNREIAQFLGLPLSTYDPITNFDMLELGVKLDDGNQVKGRKNVDGLYVHLATRVAED